MSQPPESSLPPGVTRYDVARVSTWGRQEPSVVAVGAGFGLVVAALPVAFGTDPVEALVAYAAALALCGISALLPGLVRLVWLLLGGVVGVAVIGGSEGDAGSELVSYLFGLWTGVALLLPLLHHRDQRRRDRTAVGAPPHRRDPRRGHDVGTLATWRDGAHEHDALDPDAAVVLDAVRRLDGRTRCYVSVYRGRGRLDVVGDAASGLVVQQTDDRRLPGWDTNVVLDPTYAASGEAGERVAYALGGVVDRGRVVGLAAAETAVRTWLHSGTRDSGLTWRHLRMSDAHPQPTALRRTD